VSELSPPAGDAAPAVALAQRFAAGEPEATQLVWKRVSRILAYRAYSIPAEDRRDLVQEIVTQVWLAATRPGFDAARGFWGFVEVVSTRRCIDWMRARRSAEPVDPDHPETSPSPLDRLLSRERADRAQAALGRLPRACRELIYLHAGLGKSYGEIAFLLGKSEGALRVQMFRCLQHARQVLGE
jgi:RNA polymerase sigma-70 factor (ECF subfamily)